MTDWDVSHFPEFQSYFGLGPGVQLSGAQLDKMDSLAFYFQALEFHPVDLTAIQRERLLLQGWLSEKS